MSRVEVMSGPERRRSEEQKRAIVAEAFAPGASVSVVARRADVVPGQIYRWRRELGCAVAGFAEVVVAPSCERPEADAAAVEVALGADIRIRIPATTPKDAGRMTELLLPRFRYHPDPVATGMVVPRRDFTCGVVANPAATLTWVPTRAAPLASKTATRSGWFDYGYAVLMDGALALVRTDHDVHAEYTLWRAQSKRGRTPAKLWDGRIRLSIFDGSVESEAIEVPLGFAPLVDRLADGHWLVAARLAAPPMCPATGHRLGSPVIAKALQPPDRGADADVELLGCLTARPSSFHKPNDPHSQLTRIRSTHWPILQRINALDSPIRRAFGIPIHSGWNLL